MNKSTKLQVILTALGILTLFSIQAFAQKPGAAKPFSLQVTALQGLNSTELYSTFTTSDPVKYPVPASLKKLQIKIVDQAGEVSYINNAKQLNLTGGQLATSIQGRFENNTLRVLAGIQTPQTVNEQVITVNAAVKLRPNVKIDQLNAPEEKKVNEPFNVEAFITETNLQTGASLSVSLYQEGTLVTTVQNVTVSAGGNASVIFAALTHGSTGVQNYTVALEGITPGDYNESDNTGSFAVNFINPNPPVNQAQYSFSYERVANQDYRYRYSYLYSGQTIYENSQQGNFEYLNYGVHTYSAPVASYGQQLSATYKIETSDNRSVEGSFTNLASYYYYYGYNYYNGWDQANFVYFNGYIDNYGYAHAYINRSLSNYVYYYNDIYGYSGYYENRDPLNSFLNEGSQLKITLTATVDNYSFGGAATLNVSPLQHRAEYSNYNYYDYYWGDVNYYYNYNYDYSYNYSNGLTDVSMLQQGGASGSPVLASEEIPAEFNMEQNYPNPFNPNTTIKFGLPESDNVVLKIYNAVGAEVATLINRPMSAGFHTVNFDASGLASGIYIYRIQTKNNVQINKMVLMK